MIAAPVDRRTPELDFHDWIRGCLAKAPYWSMEDATKAARRKGRARRCKLYAYPCRHCCGFHLATVSSP